jgi:hypothetical protein
MCSCQPTVGLIVSEIFFILYSGVMLLERVTGHISYILTINEHYHIYHSIIDERTTNLNTAYPQER